MNGVPQDAMNQGYGSVAMTIGQPKNRLMSGNVQKFRLSLSASVCCVVVVLHWLVDPCSAESLGRSLYLKHPRVSSALLAGSVAKIHHRRFRHVSVLTYFVHAPHVTMAAALLHGVSEQPRSGWHSKLFLGGVSLANGVHQYSRVAKEPRALLMSARASSSMVGTIMALLATFDEAGILPPEGTAQANEVIHGLIQLQSTLMKSASAELAAYQMAAEDSWKNQHQDMQGGILKEKGLTLSMLEALIVYDHEHPMWNDPKIVSAMQAFNVTQANWLFIVDLFHKADAVFRDQGRSMHTVYDAWRMKIPSGLS